MQCKVRPCDGCVGDVLTAAGKAAMVQMLQAEARKHAIAREQWLSCDVEMLDAAPHC
jgi:hypothetical protein